MHLPENSDSYTEHILYLYGRYNEKVDLLPPWAPFIALTRRALMEYPPEVCYAPKAAEYSPDWALHEIWVAWCLYIIRIGLTSKGYWGLMEERENRVHEMKRYLPAHNVERFIKAKRAFIEEQKQFENL